MITREFNLYLHAGHSIPLVINVNQYDRGEQWLFTLFNADGTQYTPSSGAIVGIKSDNLGIINSGTVDSQGRVVINETQQMTAAVGKAVFELLIDDQTHGTANFVVLVEPKPGDNADLSESDYSLFQQAIDGTSATAIAQGVSDWMDENLTPTTPVVDASLTVQGAAADAKKTGDEISDLKSQISSLSSIPTAVKNALDTLFQNVAFKNDDVYTDEIAVVHNWASAINLLSISAVYTQSGTVYENASLDSLKADLVVTASYDNGTTSTVNDYTLSGELTEGTSVITVAYGGKTTTFNVTVSVASRELLFGVFENGYSIGKSTTTSVSNLQQYLPFACRNSASARATTHYPFTNNGYVFTVTDSAKYNIAVYDTLNNNAITAQGFSDAVDGTIYRCGNKSVAWTTSDSASTDYVWVSLKKMDGTAFTAEELANGAEAVFTYTSGGVRIADSAEFVQGSGYYRDGTTFDLNEPNLTNRMVADLGSITFNVGDTISLGDYSTYKYAVGLNYNGAPSGKKWLTDGYVTSDFTIQSYPEEAKVILIARNDNADMTQSDYDYINAHALIIKS